MLNSIYLYLKNYFTPQSRETGNAEDPTGSGELIRLIRRSRPRTSNARMTLPAPLKRERHAERSKAWKITILQNKCEKEEERWLRSKKG